MTFGPFIFISNIVYSECVDTRNMKMTNSLDDVNLLIVKPVTFDKLCLTCQRNKIQTTSEASLNLQSFPFVILVHKGFVC
jgi:hypothetical protein